MFSPISEILEDLRQGKMIVLTDDENRENEGDLVLPAQFVTPDAVTFMLKEAKGYLCLSLTESDCDRLDLVPQASQNTSVRGTAFTVSIDGHPKHGFTTGVSARERAKCIAMAIDPKSTPDDFVRPGHINPLRSRNGGTLVRTGQTEGSVDLCRMAGLSPAAMIIEIMRDDGEMARVPDLEKFCAQHKIKMCSVAQIIEHRIARESLVRRVGPPEGRPVRTPMGTFTAITFESLVDPLPHMALCVGDIGKLDGQGRTVEIAEPTLVRMHRRHLLGDVFGDLDSSRDGATGDTLRAAMRSIQKAGRGAIVYLRSEHAGEGLEADLQHIRRGPAVPGADTPDLTRIATSGVNTEAGDKNPMSQRDFGVGGQILRSLGLSKLRLLTNHKRDLPGLDAFGLQIVEHVPVS